MALNEVSAHPSSLCWALNSHGNELCTIAAPPIMAYRHLIILFLSLYPLLLRQAFAVSDPTEVDALRAIHSAIGDGDGNLQNWVGNDPCGTPWTGVYCDNFNGTQRVVELRLLNMNLTGTLAPDIGNLTQLIILDVMWNNITGSIPPEIGNLTNLFLLLLNGNKLGGTLPHELGNLSNLNRIQIDQNNISGQVPSSFQYLNNAKHFHMNNNSLNGSIPPELGRLESLVHLLLDNNDLSGELPAELANISTLLIIQLDNNQFNGTIPSNYSQLFNLTKMSLRNCNLSGAVPNLTALTSLGYLDLSHNNLTGGLPSGKLSEILTTIDLSFNNLDGELPADYFAVPTLQSLILRDNLLDGNISANLLAQMFTAADSVLILDFQNNNFSEITFGLSQSVPNITFRLYGNPVCTQANVPQRFCSAFNGSITDIALNVSSIPMTPGCSVNTCDTALNNELNYGLLQLGVCQCAYPLSVGYRLKSPGFAVYPPYETMFESYMSSQLNFSLYQVNASDFTWEPGPRLGLDIKLFPSKNAYQFNESEVSLLFETFTNWKIGDNNTFGPYEVLYFEIGFPYNLSSAATARKSLSGGAIAGIVIAAVALTAIIVGAATFLIIRWRHPYTVPGRLARHHERIKVAGVKDFTYDEMSKATNNFDSSMQIGQGGYGKVYKAVLADGLIVAIKRAQEGSLQGSKEFYTEIELLSRCHHRNLVALVGFCDDEGEQMLVYEYMANGTLRDHLDSNSKKPLDFRTRIQIALGSAKGILYLHTEANPPIYHRDIKASNILLDQKRTPKVADFGLSKLAPVPELEGDVGGHVSTVVKGTPGYLDPEYFLTHKLTDKSDVYSFGVVLLELVTGMQPISHGKNLVREVNLAYEAGMMLSIVDPRMGSYPSEALEPLLRLAISSCKDDPEARPSMAEVARELEAIWKITPGSESMTSMEMSVDTESGATVTPERMPILNNPYVSSDIDGSGLMSGTIPNVAPR